MANYSTTQRTEIWSGLETISKKSFEVLSRAKETSDYCHDSKSPSFLVTNDMYLQMIKQLKAKGIRQRFITEITQENVRYSKELAKHVELRHLEGLKGNFGIVDGKEYGAAANIYDLKPPIEFIYSNVKTFVEQQQYFFETLWNKAIPAEQKIKEIEEGVTRYGTRIIENPDEVIKEIGRLTASSNMLDTCLTSGGLQYSHKYFFDIKKKLLDKQRRGEHQGIRYVTNIDKDNLYISKLYLKHGIQIRHVKNLPPMSFGVSDKEIAVTIEKMEGGKRVQSLLISNEPLYVRHFTSLFEEIWSNAIDAQYRIKQVEEGVESDIEVIQNPDRTEELYWDIVKSAEKEILLILATTNAVIRQERMGTIKYLADAAKNRNIQVRILMPKANSSHHAIEEEDPKSLQQQKDNPSDSLDVRYLQQLSDTKATILIADRKVSLVIELRDDSKSTFYEAIGLSIYSTSKPGVLSYVSIFENLWIQTELYEQLKLHDKMQKDFINIAAHELRTPIQPILGLTEAILSKSKDETQKELLEVVVRNAKRLRTLIENILDVTRIENQSLSLRKERLNINGIILNILEEYESRDNKRKNDLKIVFTPKDEFFVQADKGRVMQVISNLMNNAIKFTVKGTIIVTTKKKEESNEIVVSIKDSGPGIDPEIMPRLFSKFATKSQTGTGLGLFVSQNIVEAHGGKIWAENNSDGRGCTFSFSLPLTNNNNI